MLALTKINWIHVVTEDFRSSIAWDRSLGFFYMVYRSLPVSPVRSRSMRPRGPLVSVLASNSPMPTVDPQPEDFNGSWASPWIAWVRENKPPGAVPPSVATFNEGIELCEAHFEKTFGLIVLSRCCLPEEE